METARGFSVSQGRTWLQGWGCVASRWAGPLGDGEVAAAVPSGLLGLRGPELASRQCAEHHRIFSEPGSFPRGGLALGPARDPRDLLKALPGAVWVPADDMEGRGERASPALAQRPSAFHYCLLLLDRAAATSGPHVCIQIPGGPGLESRSAPWELSALGQFLNLDRYFLKIPASGLSRGLVSSQAVDKRSPEWCSAKALPLTGSRVSALVFQDLVTMVEQLARFLGVSCDKAQLESLIEHCHQLVDQCCNAEALPVGRGMACLALGFPPPPC